MNEALKPFWEKREPDYVNDEGVKWWGDKEMTLYAHEEDVDGVSLPNVFIWLVEKPNGYKTRIMLENGEPVCENQSMDAMASRIDIMKVSKKL